MMYDYPDGSTQSCQSLAQSLADWVESSTDMRLGFGRTIPLSDHPPWLQTKQCRIKMLEIIAFIEDEVKTALLAHRKEIKDVTSFGVVRLSNGIYSLRVYWSGKAEKGAKTNISVELDTNPTNAKLAIDAMEKAIRDASTLSIADRIRGAKKQGNGDNPWANEDEK